MYIDEEMLECPYCERKQAFHSYDEEISANYITTECEECGKKFWYTVKVTRDYDSHKMEEDDEAGM